MKQYLDNLIPRLRQFSQTLDRTEIFVEVPWVIIDENSNQQKYIFQRNGELVMSLNGQVTMGKWEYISGARSLLIDRIQDKILLNQNFIDPGVMILKKDGFKDENFILANEILIPDLNVAEYLKKLYYRNHNIFTYKMKNGKLLEIYNAYDHASNNQVSIEGEIVLDGMIEFDNSKKKYQIMDSKILKILIDKFYQTNKGEIVIEQTQYLPPLKGDLVFQYEKPAPDGKYRLGFLNNIVVEGGRIIKV